MAAGNADGVGENIKKVFQSWDVDGTGVISRENLAVVMMKITNSTRANANLLMDEIDTNKDGVINYEEFVDWVMNPNAKTRINQEGNRLEKFDYAETLRPLFEIYDRSGNQNFISAEDFKECHNIVQGALKMFPEDSGVELDHAAVSEVDDVFQQADAKKDGQISFEEFVGWQKSAMEKSGIPNWGIKSTIETIAKVMGQIFMIDEMAAEGHETCETSLLKHIETLSQHAKGMYNVQKQEQQQDDETSEYPNHWAEPPVGLSLDRLVKFHLADVRVRTFKLKSCNAEVRLCVPQVPSEVKGSRLWYAKVQRTTLYENSPNGIPNKETFYYEYHDLSWSRSSESVFNHAVETMPKEILLFCLFKTEANMGVKLSWKGIQSGFEDALEMGLLKEMHVNQYNKMMMEMAHDAMEDEGTHMDLEDMDMCHKEHAEKLLHQRVQMAPRLVMAGLADMKIVAPSRVWDEFMNDGQEEAEAE
jgi:Ca2+-binding EF-hand superfamily protein